MENCKNITVANQKGGTGNVKRFIMLSPPS